MRQMQTTKRTRTGYATWRFVALGIIFLFALRETGCSYTITGNPVSSLVTVTLSPQSATITTGGQLQVTATVANSLHNSSVSWSIDSGGAGQISASGDTAIYTAPSTIAMMPTLVTIRVRSNEDQNQTATCVVTIENPGGGGGKVALALNPLSVTLNVGTTEQFKATVSGSSDSGVMWKVVSGVGTLSSSGLFTAPASITSSPTTTVIQATAHADTSKHQTATIAIVNPIADTLICFQADILPMLVSNCGMSGCHSPGGHSPDLTSYASIRGSVRPGNANSSRIYTAISQSNSDDKMPPPPRTALSAAQIALLGRWINQGAQNTSCTDTSSTCDTTDVLFSGFVAGVMTTYCNGCHTGASAGLGIDLTTYAGVQAVAQNGKLMGSLNQLSGYYAMPQSGPKLDACTLSKIGAWVNAGAKNN
jgi:mono/diheme cytochrome c family protein